MGIFDKLLGRKKKDNISNKEGEKCPVCGFDLSKIMFGGISSTFHCPFCGADITSYMKIIDLDQKGEESNLELLSQEEGQRAPLRDALLSVKPDGLSMYVKDSNHAFRWYREKGFSYMDHNTLVGAKWFAEMSLRADDSSIWQEAWAGYHHALAGYVHLNILEEIPDILWRIGRAHIGQGEYKLAYLYLESARRLSEEQHKTDLNIRVMIEQAVLAKLSKQANAFDEVMDLMSAYLFPFGQASSLATTAAQTLFQEGIKNQEWRDQGRPIKSCLIHAFGLYEVSIDLNRRLGNHYGIAVILINLGDILKELGEKNKADACWQDSLQHFEELGDDKYIRIVKERLQTASK